MEELDNFDISSEMTAISDEKLNITKTIIKTSRKRQVQKTLNNKKLFPEVSSILLTILTLAHIFIKFID